MGIAMFDNLQPWMTFSTTFSTTINDLRQPPATFGDLRRGFDEVSTAMTAAMRIATFDDLQQPFDILEGPLKTFDDLRRPPVTFYDN